MNTLSDTNTTVSSGNRILYLDYLRVFSIVAVIALHVSAQNWRKIDVATYPWQIFNLVDSISRWCVAVFVMISGALFLERQHSIKKIYSKYILRLVTAFIFWSTVYAVLSGGGIRKIILRIIEGHYHLWFIPMIIGLYICLPIIKKITESLYVTRYFLIIAFIFVFLIPQLVLLVNNFGCSSLKTVLASMNVPLTDMHLQLAAGYTGYFILGYCLNRIDFTGKQRHIIYCLGIAAFIFTVAADSYLSLKAQTPKSTFYGDFTVNVLFESICIFIFFKYHSPASGSSGKILTRLSNYSFGAYLVHILILDLLKKAGFHTLSFTPAVSVPLLIIITAVSAFLVSAVIHRIPVLKKYIV